MPALFATAEILAVGSELLTPFRSDTNSLFLTAALNEIGIDVRAKAIVRDDRDAVTAAVLQAVGRADIVVTTGGLGPTDDDVTRDAVAAAFGLQMAEDETTVAWLRERFAKRGVQMPEINRRQAQVPLGAILLPNTRGTAPGLWIVRGERVVILLPGPPRELQTMYEAVIAPRLALRTAGHRLRRRVIKIADRSESHVDEIAQPIYNAFRDWPLPIETTILAARGQIELHLSARGADTRALDASLERAVRQLAESLAPAVVSVDGRPLEAVVGDLLRARGWMIALGESCTGGLVTARLTAIPGSSAWVVGGVVAYANAVKIRDLDVPESVIAEHGAVSEPVAEAMARGAARRLGADVGVGITGVAGPDGGTAAKPVGTVVIAVHLARQGAGRGSEVRTFHFFGDRDLTRQLAAQAALNMVRIALSSE